MAEHGFPKILRQRCHPSVPSASCPARREAVKLGEMWWDWPLGGWVSVLNPVRSASWEAVYKSGQNHNGENYVLEVCPFCGSALPDLAPSKALNSGATRPR